MEQPPGQVEDLATLSTLDAKSLLEHIHERYRNHDIYTYIGDILVSVNPYQPLNIYTEEVAEQYSNVEYRRQLPPHVFAISDTCYQNIKLNGANQCCVVSGESGAGKTEVTKLLVQHLACLCRHESSDLQESIVQVNPLLEAFGNARTVINNNSSRFGKYIELQFDKAGELRGGKISEYLLEKSRVVSQGPGERNFHIFYYMFAGLRKDQLRNNLLDAPEDHRILKPADGSGKVYVSDGEVEHHQAQWSRLLETMRIVGFLAQDIQGILAILAAILHITDLVFQHDPDTDGVFIDDESRMELAADMLGVTAQDFATALISNTSQVRGEKIVTLKTMGGANDGRDALAKALYARLFGWIVRQVNVLLDGARAGKPILGPHIGILDLAGFENFQHNSFEQLCINVANEQLQFYFNQHIFTWEMDEYKREGVKGKDVQFPDNRPLLDLFLESPLGFLSLLDEESKFPKGTDQTLLDKLNKNLSKKKEFVCPKSPHLAFVIHHYAAQVTYKVDGFLEKNRDTFSLNLLETMKNSQSQFVADLFSSPISDTGALQENVEAPKRSRRSVLMCKAPVNPRDRRKSISKAAARNVKQRARNGGGGGLDVSARSLASSFRTSLTDLMAKLLDGEPHFIRCVKPNKEKAADMFQQDLVKQQLEYTGVMETVKIRRQGFATRLTHQLFVERYKFIKFPLTAAVDGTPKSCSKILKKLEIKEYEIGKTKVFLKYWHVETLNSTLAHQIYLVETCQRVVRGHLARRRVRWLRKVALQQADDLRVFCDKVSQLAQDVYTLETRHQDHDRDRQKKKVEATKPKPAANDRISKAQYLGQPTPIVIAEEKEPEPAPVSPPSQTTVTDVTAASLTALGPSSPGRTPSVHPPEPKSPPGEEPPTSPRVTYRESRVPAPNRSKILSHAAAQRTTIMTELLEDAMGKFSSLSPEIWAKLHYLEKNQVVAKVYLRDEEVIIDNSDVEYDGVTIGLSCFENPQREEPSRVIFNSIGKGVRITRDKYGNFYGQKMGDCEIIVKGYSEPENQCLSEELTSNLGRLHEMPTMIFDMGRYREQIVTELGQVIIDFDRLHRLSMTSFCFARNTFDDLDTPCWVNIINFSAIDLLGSQEVLAEAIKELNLSRAEEVQLRRNWNGANHQRMSAVVEEEPEMDDQDYLVPAGPKMRTNSTTSSQTILPKSSKPGKKKGKFWPF